MSTNNVHANCSMHREQVNLCHEKIVAVGSGIIQSIWR